MEHAFHTALCGADTEVALLCLPKGARPGRWRGTSSGTAAVEHLPLEELGCTYSGSVAPNLERKSKFKEQLGFLPKLEHKQ